MTHPLRINHNRQFLTFRFVYSNFLMDIDGLTTMLFHPSELLSGDILLRWVVTLSLGICMLIIYIGDVEILLPLSKSSTPRMMLIILSLNLDTLAPYAWKPNSLYHAIRHLYGAFELLGYTVRMTQFYCQPSHVLTCDWSMCHSYLGPSSTWKPRNQLPHVHLLMRSCWHHLFSMEYCHLSGKRENPYS